MPKKQILGPDGEPLQSGESYFLVRGRFGGLPVTCCGNKLGTLDKDTAKLVCPDCQGEWTFRVVKS